MKRKRSRANGPLTEAQISLWAPRAVSHRDKLWIAARENDRKLFLEVIQELSPDLARAAHHMVAPEQVNQLLADTWCRAWHTRHTCPGDPQPLIWLHRIMVTVAASPPSQPPTGGPTVDDELACLVSAADLEAFLIAHTVDNALALLEPSYAMVIRRRYLARQGWYTIAREMGFASPYQAWRTYRNGMKQLAALQDGQPAAETSTPTA